MGTVLKGGSVRKAESHWFGEINGLSPHQSTLLTYSAVGRREMV